MSPGSTQLPTWDNSQAMSPYMSPDMSSIASGSMIGQNSRSYDGGVNDFGHTNPLAHLSESVNNIDPLNAMEKSLNEMPHTPHTPGGAAGTPGGPPSVSSLYNEQTMNTNANHASPSNNQSPQHKSNMNNQNMMDNLSANALINSRNGGLVNLTEADLNADLNFDAAVIDDNTNDFNLLTDTVVDPMELLSYLDPPNLNTPPSSGSSNNPNNDDILAALFE